MATIRVKLCGSGGQKIALKVPDWTYYSRTTLNMLTVEKTATGNLVLCQGCELGMGGVGRSLQAAILGPQYKHVHRKSGAYNNFHPQHFI